MRTPIATGLAPGAAADPLPADRHHHRVAGFGALERRIWRNSRAVGAAHAVVLVATVTGPSVLLDRGTRRRPAGRPLAVNAAVLAVVARVMRARS